MGQDGGICHRMSSCNSSDDARIILFLITVAGTTAAAPVATATATATAHVAVSTSSVGVCHVHVWLLVGGRHGREGIKWPLQAAMMLVVGGGGRRRRAVLTGDGQSSITIAPTRHLLCKRKVPMYLHRHWSFVLTYLGKLLLQWPLPSVDVKSSK